MKTRTKVVAWLLACAMVFTTAFVPANAAKKVTVKKVSVTNSLTGKKTVVVAKGKSVKLSATVSVTPNKKANKTVSYSVKNKKIATVNKKGVVKGKKAGTTKVTVTSKKNKKKKATITVKVVKGAVTSVKLNKKKATVNVGAKLNLKATVKAAKGANKNLVFTTSNKKVATVTSKGVVTGKKAGTATITAKATDGSGKKATCKVTVKKPVTLVDLKAMDVQNARTVTFALSSPVALDATKVSVMKKAYASGKYNNKLVIDNMATADNVNYTVVLSNESGISVGSFVQVSVPSLNGKTKSLEMEYKDQLCAFNDEEISSWKVGEYRKDYFYFEGARGYSELSIDTLPAGLTSKIKNDSIVVSGTPTTTGVFNSTVSATDELGNTLKKTVHFIIGSDTVIAGAANQVYSLFGTEEASNSANLYAVGGSGNYKYETKTSHTKKVC